MSDKRLSGDERREQILEAAAHLFVDRGFEGVNMADIAEAIGTSRPNVYTYFPSTTAMLDTLLDRHMQAVQQDLLPLLQGDGTPDFSVLFGTLGQHRTLLQLMLCGGSPELRRRREQLGDLLLKGLGDERLKNRPELRALVSGALTGMIYETVVREENDTDPAVAGAALDLFLGGGVEAVLAQKPRGLAGRDMAVA